MSICFLSLETSKVFNELILKKLEKEGFDNLTSSLITIFPFIDEYNDISISALATKLGYTRQAMHKNLKKLENNLYIKFEQADNKKEKIVKLTKKGKNLVLVANSFIQSIQEKISQQVGQEELNRFIKTQEEIFEILNSKVLK
ncbi:MarR family winged helix-turn-helix transcriptional regulator [Halarcobacter sp.]|uniref:MarR family winged helix-turn-helix transcriptional regulator n=1 Tax=Halarcobacter sp. TaxID=2321133 RepID=UPI002AAA9C5B|nr:MarR family winged helix-turn-helix transcriptional regulator [Halarcobacter sp.]